MRSRGGRRPPEPPPGAIASRVMTRVTHREIDVNGLRMHVAECGEGPLVLLLHGFPESWYSWRHQLAALADAGFHAVAPDQRGYGGTTRPGANERDSLLHLVGGVIGLVDALGDGKAIVVGHDWGAPVAWHTALLRPDRVAGVAGLSVPFTPRLPVSPMDAWREAFGDRFYQVYFQAPGVAEAELEADVAETMRRLLIGASGDRPAPDTELERLAARVPPEGGGVPGGLNWYRAQDRNWALLAPWHGAVVTPPALYVLGTRDPVFGFPGMDQLVPNLRMFVPNLRDTVLLH